MTCQLRLLVLPMTLAACSGEVGSADSSALSGEPSALQGVATCTRPPKAANRTRKVVVTHPYGAGGGKRFEVLDLSTSGALTRTGATFDMGVTSETPIVFTPDGEIGMVPQTDGTIGVFRFDASGVPHVVNAALSGGFWANSITMSPRGDRAYVLDLDTSDHGGGVYQLAIGCDGSVTPQGLAFPSGGADVLTFLPGSSTRAVLTAGQAFASTAGMDTFLVDVHAPSLLGQGNAFGDTDGVRSSMDVTADGKYALIGDDDFRAGNRLAVVALPAMTSKQVLTVDAPFAVIASPYGNAALVVDGDDFNEITTLHVDPTNAAEPVTVKGPLTSTLPPPVLPGVAAQITRGQLKGRVLVTELDAVRQVQFEADGSIDDVSRTSWGKGDDEDFGTLGVQP